MAPSPVEELVMYDLDRSNKGASKQRRDQINAEIAIIRDLLPLAESARQRLSQLQIMSLSCVYIRKCNVLEKLFRSSRLTNKDNLNVPTCDFFQALTGFLLITTREGKLVYISENVTDYLGHSMVDMKTQGDSLYDIVDKRDHGTVQAQLLQAGTEGNEGATRDVAFFCRMNMSRSLKRQAGFGDVKVMYVKGHFVPYSGQESTSEQQLVFMGMCTPLITPDLKENLIQNNTMVFKTVHQLDLSFLEVSHTAEYHLGYSNGELFRKSWYGMLHPEDLQEAREKHVQLIRSNHEMGCMMIVRMIRADNSLFWVNVVMHIKQASVSNSDDPVIMCVNQVISEQEAYQFKLQSQMFQFYPPRTEPWQQTVPCPSMTQEQDTRWLQPSGFPTTSRMRTTQAGPVYTAQSGCQSQSFMPYLDPRLRRGDQLKNGGSCQTERLKDMLRRKINKGPCRPAKVPRMTLNGNDDKSSGQGFDFGSSNFMIPNLENFNESFPALAVAQGGWAESTQVMSQSNYCVPSVALQQKKSILMEPSSLSPASVLQEQVVPDVSALPDSYLTPDPSPASSPDNCKGLKVDVLNSPRSTKTIIEELEQLANMTGSTKVKSEVVSQPLPPTPLTKRRKELPVIDPLDIESFFGDFEVAKPNTQLIEDVKNSFPIQMQKKTKQPSAKPKRNLPLIDAMELEEFFNHFNGDCNSYLDAEMLVESAGTFFEQPALIKEEDSAAAIKMECSNSPASQSMSPRSMASCDLSEEDEIIEELTADPMEMTLSVTVKDEFMPLETQKPCGSFEEDELYQLQKLLTSLAPQNGAIALSEETQ